MGLAKGEAGIVEDENEYLDGDAPLALQTDELELMKALDALDARTSQVQCGLNTTPCDDSRSVVPPCNRLQRIP